MGWPPRSPRYDDIYFSRDGLAEKRAVFIRGAHLRETLVERRCLCVGELGFGTGLSALATWCELRKLPGFVHFVSIEGAPLPSTALNAALAPFDEIADERKRLLQLYPEHGPGPGVHHFDLDERFALSLWVGDVEEQLTDFDGSVDAWFLDGFAPAKNPRMWSRAVLGLMARLSVPGARIASYSAAGEVRRGLEASGFRVDRFPGFGGKRHRLEGRFDGTGRQAASCRQVAIVGAGIAGRCVARSLARRQVNVTLFDANREWGASSNPIALVSPRTNRCDDTQSRFHIGAFEYAARCYRDRCGFHRVGVLRLAVDHELHDRFSKALAYSTLSYGPSQYLKASEASEHAGVSLRYGGLWMPEGGFLEPHRIMETLGEFSVDAGALTPWDPRLDLYDHIVVCLGPFSSRWFPALPLRASRGQITLCSAPASSPKPRCVLSAHGYLTPALHGVHAVGATYRRAATVELGRTVAEAACDDENLRRLSSWAPQLASQFTVVGHRAALRSTMPDHMPLIETAERSSVVTALGSRGFALAPLAGEIVACGLVGSPRPTTRAAADVLGARHFRRTR